MPFKLRLKKSRHYNVISKSLFVISVELLDGTTIECSLSAESLGSSCLDYVCQRLNLQQPEFFGLCYMSRHNVPHWIELDTSLKKQLDKYARDMNLYLRVMYYVNGVSLLQDETTRYHYFLQVKKDVIEGRVSCSVEQAVRLASLSMQAEFGDHDMERHTAEYLRDFVSFPQHILENSPPQLFEAVVRQHAALGGLPQAAAEEQYILLAQQLDGYGQETFEAKDMARNKALLCVSLTGIFIGIENPPSYKNFPWREISNVIIHKKNFVVECERPEENAQLEFTELETAKYVWKLCILQHKFFTKFVQASETNGKEVFSPSTTNAIRKIGSQPDINCFMDTRRGHETTDNLVDYQNTVTTNGGPIMWSGGETALPNSNGIRAKSTSCLNLTAENEIVRLRSLLPSYRPAPDYDTAIQRKYMQLPQAQAPNQNSQPTTARIIYSSQPEIHQTHLHEAIAYPHRYPDVTQVYVENEATQLPPNAISFHNYSTPELDKMENHLLASLQLLQLYKAPPPYRDNTARPNSNSTPDLASQTCHKPLRTTITNPQMSGSSPDLVSSRHFTTYEDQHHLSQNAAHRTYTNLAALTQPEPIYENIPPPWRDPEHEMSNLLTTQNLTTQSVTVNNSNPSIGSNNKNHTTIVTVPGSVGVGAVSISPSQGTSARAVVQQEDNGTSKGNGSASVSFDSSADQSTSSVDSNTKMRTWKKWGLLVKGKSNTLQKARPKNQVSRDHPHRWSTGLPRLPLPPTVSKETMCQLLERKLADTQLLHEFERIPKRQTNADLTTAQLPENALRNRFADDALPYEENRVRLQPTRENRTGYVNASRISATVGANQRFYVAAQTPATHQTLDAFWQCVWEADVYLVVRLDGPQEDATTGVSCLPQSSDHCLRLQEFQIWKEFSQETGHCTTSRLRINHIKARRSRSIWHLQYTKWGEHGCPTSPVHFLGFLEELNSVRQHTTEDIPAGHNRNPPVLVHCTAGVGRTGVAIVCDILLHTLELNQEVDIPRVVASLRHQRMLMVQTVAQYRFIYSLLIAYLKQSRLI